MAQLKDPKLYGKNRQSLNSSFKSQSSHQSSFSKLSMSFSSSFNNFHIITKGCGILGFVKFLKGYYLLVIT